MANVVDLRTSALQPITISIFSQLIGDVLSGGRWLLGDDASTIATHASDLALIADVMDTGIREDDAIRTEATRIIRILQRRAVRDFAGGLIDADEGSMSLVLDPDAWEVLMTSIQPIEQGSYSMTVTASEQIVDAQGRSSLKMSAVAA